MKHLFQNGNFLEQPCTSISSYISKVPFIEGFAVLYSTTKLVNLLKAVN